MIPQRLGEPSEKLLAQCPGARYEAFVFDDVQIGQSCRRGGRVPRCGDAVAEDVYEGAGVFDYGPDRLADQNCRHRQITAREPLSCGHQVGSYSETVGAEPSSEPAKSADDLIEYEQNVIPVENLPDRAEIIFRR